MFWGKNSPEDTTTFRYYQCSRYLPLVRSLKFPIIIQTILHDTESNKLQMVFTEQVQKYFQTNRSKTKHILFPVLASLKIRRKRNKIDENKVGINQYSRLLNSKG